MHKKMFGMFLSLVALVAFAVTPAFAQATPTLMQQPEEGEATALKVGEPVYVWSEGFELHGFITGSCNESEIITEVTENPGATAEIVSSRFEGGGVENRCWLTASGRSFDIVDLVGSFEFNEGSAELLEASMKVRFFLANGSYYAYCTYGIKSESALSPGFMRLETFNVTPIEGTLCPSFHGTGTFHVDNQFGNPITVVG